MAVPPLFAKVRRVVDIAGISSGVTEVVSYVDT